MNARTVNPRTVRLQGGPFDGQPRTALCRDTIHANGDPLPDGQVARYRPTADPDVYEYVGPGTEWPSEERAA